MKGLTITITGSNKHIKESEKHKKLNALLSSCVSESFEYVKTHYAEWDHTNALLSDSYADDSANKPIIPSAFFTFDVLKTYLKSAFVEGDVFTYEAVNADKALGAMFLNASIRKQLKDSGFVLKFDTLLRDALIYNIGIVHTYWDSEKKLMPSYDETQGRVVMEEKPFFQGTKLFNVLPYQYLPDVRVAASDVNSGSYVGWWGDISYYELVDKNSEKPLLNFDKQLFDATKKSNLITVNDNIDDCAVDENGDYIDTKSGKKSHCYSFAYDYREAYNVNSAYSNSERKQTIQDINPVYRVVDIFVRIIPNDFGLSKSNELEIWFFQVVNNAVIITAEKYEGVDDKKFPVVVCAPDCNGYKPIPVGRLAMLNTLHEYINFLLEARKANQVNAIGGVTIIDPTYIDEEDLKNAKGNKVVKFKRGLNSNKGVNDVLKYIPKESHTEQNIGEAITLMSTADSVAGVNDAAKGVIPKRTNRVSASEVNNSMQSALSRLKSICLVISAQTMLPLAHVFADNFLMHLDEIVLPFTLKELEVIKQENNIAIEDGELENLSLAQIPMSYIVTGYDDFSVDNSELQNLMDLYGMALQDPSISGQINVKELFRRIAARMNIKNVELLFNVGNNIAQSDIDAQLLQQQQQQQGFGEEAPPLPEGLEDLSGLEAII